MAIHSAATDINGRSEPRDEVYFRARALRTDGQALPMTIVNISPNGLMARCETALDTGDHLNAALPVVGTVRAVVRWSLGGRIGCQLDQAIPVTRYYELLATLRR